MHLTSDLVQYSKACEANLEKISAVDSLSCAAKVSLFKLSHMEASFVCVEFSHRIACECRSTVDNLVE